MNVDCPKCGSSSAWYERTFQDLIVRCLCGYHKVVFTTLEQAEVQHNDAGVQVKLPREGTHLKKTLMVVECLEEASTADITERLRDMRCPYTVSDVASYLTILRSKGLVETSSIRRGVAGGSIWLLTDAASDLLAVS